MATIQLASTRFGPGETIRASFEPGPNDALLFWRLFQPRKGGATEVLLVPVKTKAYQSLYVFEAIDLPGGGYNLQVWTGGDDLARHLEASKIEIDELEVAQVRELHKVGSRGKGPALALADEQVFEVSKQPDLRVSLDRAQPQNAITDDPLATYRSFEQFLAKKGGPVGKNPFDGSRPDFALFTDDDYDKLKRLASRYVRRIQLKSPSLIQLAEPYIRGRMESAVENLPADAPLVIERLPGIELIWNFWQEAGMFVQTLNLILARFQNRVVPGGYSALERFDVSPLLTLQGVLYAFVDDEQHRMTVRRRAAQYEYEYGLQLIGKAIPPARTYVERRSGFLEAFHHVLYQAHVYFKETDDLTVSADAFPLYRSLRECHLELSHGSHNQYGQLAVAARAEFLVMQFLLSQPEMREFLGGRPMTPYSETWMDRVDRMKEIQPGWPAASTMHFHDLATFGERLVLTIRLGSWADPTTTSTNAKAWADTFREPIQKYVAAYRAVTGVDLSQEPDASQPAVLIQQRVRDQRIRA